MNDFFDLLNGFRINGAFPIDSRFVTADEAARLAIPVNAVYKGLFTIQADTNVLYVYQGDDQTNAAEGWVAFEVNNIDPGATEYEFAPNGNTLVTLVFEDGERSTPFVVQRGTDGPEAQYFIEVIGEFAEDTSVPAPTGGSYNVDTRVLDVTGLTAGWFDPFTQQVPALADGNAYYRSRVIIIPARVSGTINNPAWSSPVQLSGDQGPQGQTGPGGAPGIDGDDFAGVTYTGAVSRGDATFVQPIKRDEHGVESPEGDPFPVRAGHTGDSISDVDIVTQGGTGQPTTIQFEATRANGSTFLLPTQVTIPPGASGSGTGDVLVSGNVAVGQYAKWAGPTSISGQTGVPEGDITGLPTINGSTDLGTIITDLDGRGGGVADVSRSEWKMWF